jgi:nucleoside-diphosphate-sugar epimerase
MNVVAITGAGGMIGRHLVEVLKPSAGQVRILVLPNEPVPPCCDKAVVFSGDIRRPQDLRDFIYGVDTVFHLAALVGKDASTLAESRAVNVSGTRNLVELAKVSGVRRFVLLSTCCVYGLYSFRDEILNERAPHAPIDRPYDRTKTEAEELVAAEDPARLPWSVLQVPVVLGGAHTVNKPNLMAHIRMVRSGFIPYSFADCSWANFVYAGDVATALTCLGEHPLSAGKAFIFNETVPLNDLFALIARELNVGVRWVPVPGFGLRLAARANHRLAVLANQRRFSSEKIRSLLGYSPSVGLEEGVRVTISHYRNTGLIA